MTLAMAGLAMPVSALVMKWDTGTPSGSTTISCSSGQGNSCAFSNDGKILKARAYSTGNDNGSGKFEKARINIHDGGIGVRNYDDENESKSPYHAIDNNESDDLVVFEFEDETYNPTAFMIGWRFGDADIRAWIGGEDLRAGYNFTDKRFSDLAGLGFTSFSFSNVAVDTLVSFNTDLAGRYLIFAPALYDTPDADKKYDYFMISQVVVENPPDTIPQEVPEPGILGLLGITLAGLWSQRRRRV
jgi:hypothetical protein